VRVLRRRPSCPPFASLSLCLRAREAEGIRCRSLQPELLTRGHEPTFELAALPPRRTVLRSASSGRALAGDPPGEATSICAAVRDMPRGMPFIPLRVLSRFETAPALASSPHRPCHRASAPSFPGALRTSTEPATISCRAARFRAV